MNVESPLVLFSSDGQEWRKPDRPLRWASDDDRRVTKIVVGSLANPGEKAKTVSLKSPLPADLARRFPQLSHLHLWNVENLASLPELPDALRVLDLRACPQLESLPKLPAQLESLILADCPAAVLPMDQSVKFPALTELILSGSVLISANWIERTLAGSPAIRRLDLSRCRQVEHVKSYPSQLVDLRLDECESLQSLRSPWPAGLRRVSLRGASRLPGIPRDWPASLDYVDLRHARSLAELPRPARWPRTLFLFGSGVHVPPVSEHGSTADENVAARTAKFFADVDLTGQGDVNRCKLLILGNGEAGKTCLSAALVPDRDPHVAAALGSTHGVQFWEWDFPAPVKKGVTESVQLTLWDFGGQEIYHNTHRLFMSTGAVFLVVWNSNQDGRQPEPKANGYQDEWRPLQYWLDFIRQACPHAPRIAIVASHQDGPSPELEERLRTKLRRDDFESIPRFYVNSLSETREIDGGGLSKLRQWLESNVGGVVESQGTAVPAYWEIAQDMVAGWVRRMEKDEKFAKAHNYLTPAQFRQHLDAAIESRTVDDSTGRFAKLRDAVRSGQFQLDEDRLRRTLEFLTHSGWAYWDPKLFQGQVIIGQKWALDGLYAVLERRDGSTVFQSLTRSGGRFTLDELSQWRWNAAGYGEEEEKLLLSFMDRCGLCFQLRRGYEAWREQDVYVSFEHLPKLGRDALTRQFDSRLTKTKTETWDRAVPGLHKYHWQRFLYAAGAHYGKDAQYALDGFYLENREREKLLVLCELDPSGLGGRIEVRVGGKKADERLKSAVEYVERFLPDREPSQPVSPESGMGTREEKCEVFISYAWDPEQNDGKGGIPPGYEEPVNAIERFLRDKPVIPYRDKTSMKWGDNITTFMQHGATRPHVIVVHSDKSWKSPFCCYELLMVKDQLLDRKDRDFLSVVIPVEHPTSRINNKGAVDEYVAHWQEFNERDLPGSVKQDAHHFVTAAAPGVIEWFHRKLSIHKDVNLKWPSDGKADAARQAEVLAKIAERLGLDRKP